jgi:serine/threonine protein phosphatase PrpC
MHLFSEMDMDAGVVHPLAAGHAGLFTRRSPGKPGPSEDAAVLLGLDGTRGILGIADGVGGHAHGGEAARTMVETLASFWRDAIPAGMDTQTAILGAIQAAHKTVLSWNVGAATTLVAVELQGRFEAEDGSGPAEHIRPYHAGDSMALVIGEGGEIRHQTVSHSPVGYALEAGLIDEEDALRHQDRHLVSNAIGLPDMHIEVGPSIALAPGDSVLLASDGLFDNFTMGAIAEHVRTGPLGETLDALVDDCRERMVSPRPDQPTKPDDLTLILWRPSS